MIEQISMDLHNESHFSDMDATGVVDFLKSGFINSIFYGFLVNADGFHIQEAKCVGCGKCAELCPLNNITLTGGKPAWGKRCTHCMACIHRCPTEAIEYKRNTQSKLRYSFDRQ